MEITVTPKQEVSQVVVTVAVPNEDFTPFVERAIGTLGKEIQLKGFRAGKAPRNLVMEHVGQDRILHEAMDFALPHFFAEAAVAKELQIVGRPAITIEELGLDTPFKFTATADVIPTITLGAPSSLSAKKKRVVVSDEQLDHELKHLVNMRSTTAQVARPAQKGDVALVDFQVKIDGTPIEGGESKNHPVNIGEGRFIPGFEDGLIGMSAGEEKTYPVHFPEDYGKKDLQGKQAEAWVKVISVQEKTAPTLDDEFAKSLGGAFKSLEELKNKLRSNMLEELTAKEEERYRGELAEQLMEASTLGTIPASLVEHEIDRRMEEFAAMLSYQQKTLEEYALAHDTTIVGMRDTMKESATKQVKVGLVLRELAKQHDVSASEEEIAEEVNRELARFGSVEEAKKEVDPNDIKDYAAHAITNKKTLDLLVELANKKP